MNRRVSELKQKKLKLNNLWLKIYDIIVLLVNLYSVILFYDSIIDTNLVMVTKWFQLSFSNIHTRICWL